MAETVLMQNSLEDKMGMAAMLEGKINVLCTAFIRNYFYRVFLWYNFLRKNSEA